MLDERDKRILCAIVQSYINNPDPVGSRFITRKYAFSLSPSTIRNTMADLEEMGFLTQPHTSAGRVPTDKGYRFYVDSLSSGDYQINNRSFVSELTRELESIRDDIDILLDRTTRRLSNFSHYLSVALSPAAGETTFNRLELLKHKGSRVVAVLFTNEGLIKNKVIEVDAELTQHDLNRISAYLNSEFYDHTLDEIHSRLLKEMAREKVLCDKLISRALRICKEALSFTYGNIFISGLAEVLELPDFSEVEKIREISRAIEDKHLIVKLLDRFLELDGVQVIIGSENSIAEMRRFSIVASTYKEGSRSVGSVGIIGPTRMDYSKAIAMVDTAARFITRILSVI